MKLFAFVKRKDSLTREEFLDHWHNVHGPMIRDTPALGGHILDYRQYPASARDRSGWDGVAVQEFESWESLIAFISSPAGEAMRADEETFIDSSTIKVVFVDDEVVMIDGESDGERVDNGR